MDWRWRCLSAQAVLALLTGLWICVISLDVTAGLRDVLLRSSLMGVLMPDGPGSCESSLRIAGSNSIDPSVVVRSVQEQLDCFSSSGRWVYDPTPRFIASNFLGSSNLRKCDTRFASHTPGAVSGDNANNIAAASGQADKWIVRQQLKWVWRTDESVCPFLEIDRDEFCRRIGSNRNVLVVGDSISQETYWILLNHLIVNRSGWQAPRHAFKERHVRGDWEVCQDVLGGPGRGFRVGHVRNDRLSFALETSADKKHNFYEYPWINSVEPWNISVFILNRGAHYEEDAIYRESLVNAFSVIKYRWPTALVFYRSTPPGHPNCTDHHEPLKERESADRLREYSGHFHWADFARQNEIARTITQQFGYIFLDLDAMMALRPDSHLGEGDCLHYCLPGPLDVSAQLLYNALLHLPGT